MTYEEDLTPDRVRDDSPEPVLAGSDHFEPVKEIDFDQQEPGQPKAEEVRDDSPDDSPLLARTYQSKPVQSGSDQPEPVKETESNQQEPVVEEEVARMEVSGVESTPDHGVGGEVAMVIRLGDGEEQEEEEEVWDAAYKPLAWSLILSLALIVCLYLGFSNCIS